MRLFALLLLIVLLPSFSWAETLCSPAKLGEVHIMEETTGFSIDVAYPVLCRSEATRMLRDHVTGELAGFKLDFPDHDLTEFPHKYEMIVQYKTRTAAHGRLISVKLHTMVYSGGAHPNNWPETWVFDLTDGHRLTLADVFGNVNEALIAIAPGVRESLRASLGEMVLDDMLLPGTMPTLENFRDFIITDTGLTFFFAPYQVAPYAAGEQAVAVPWEQCRPFLAPSFAALLQ